MFESIGDWGVTTAVAPPEGFVADYDELSAAVNDEREAVQFTVVEIGSDLVPTLVEHNVKHKGRKLRIRSAVDIFLMPKYARSQVSAQHRAPTLSRATSAF